MVLASSRLTTECGRRLYLADDAPDSDDTISITISVFRYCLLFLRWSYDDDVE